MPPWEVQEAKRRFAAAVEFEILRHLVAWRGVSHIESSRTELKRIIYFKNGNRVTVSAEFKLTDGGAEITFFRELEEPC